MKRLFRSVMTVFLLAAAALCSACGSSPVSSTALLMDTVCTVTLHEPADAALAEEALALAAEYEALFSSTEADSDIARINGAGGAPVEVSPLTAELLALSMEASRRSEGAFDVTVGGLSSLWDFGGANTVPEAELIGDALPHVGTEVMLSGNTVTLADPLTQLEPGAVAKGYAAGLVAEHLLEQGVTTGILDFGGTIVTLGAKEDGSPWRIGIQKPFAPQGEVLGVVTLKGGSMVTSGVYQRFFEQDGVRYHHILDPKTGRPAETELLSVTVVGEDPGMGDALSTACLILGEAEGSALLEETEGVYGAVWVYEDRISVTGAVDFEEQ